MFQSFSSCFISTRPHDAVDHQAVNDDAGDVHGIPEVIHEVIEDEHVPGLLHTSPRPNGSPLEVTAKLQLQLRKQISKHPEEEDQGKHEIDDEERSVGGSLPNSCGTSHKGLGPLFMSR